jgi:hypothetical protein
VAFAAEIASANWLFRHDLETGATLVVSSNHAVRGDPQISADGRYIAFDDGRNVFRWELGNGDLVNVAHEWPSPALGCFALCENGCERKRDCLHQ